MPGQAGATSARVVLGTTDAVEADEPSGIELSPPRDLEGVSGLASYSMGPDSSGMPWVQVAGQPAGVPLERGPLVLGGVSCNQGHAECMTGQRVLRYRDLRPTTASGPLPAEIVVRASDQAGNEQNTSVGVLLTTFEEGVAELAMATTGSASMQLVSAGQVAGAHFESSIVLAQSAIRHMSGGPDVLTRDAARALVAGVERQFEAVSPTAAHAAAVAEARVLVEDARFHIARGEFADAAASARAADVLLAPHTAVVNAIATARGEAQMSWDLLLQEYLDGAPLNRLRVNPQRATTLHRLNLGVRDAFVSMYAEMNTVQGAATVDPGLSAGLDRLDRSSSATREEGDLVRITNLTAPEGCVDSLTRFELDDRQFALCVVAITDLAMALDAVGHERAGTLRWRWYLRSVVRWVVELSLYLSPVSLAFVVPGGETGVMLDDPVAQAPALAVSALDEPDMLIARLYDVYDVLRDPQAPIEAWWPAVLAVRCLQVEVFNRYYSTNNTQLNVSIPHEVPIDGTLLGCN